MKQTNFKTEEMFDFCTQMSMILSSGLTVQEGLEIIITDTKNPHMKETCEHLLTNIKDLGSFYASIKDEDYFDMYAKHMIEIGEVSGHLDSVMEELATYYERSYDLSRALKEALLYPFVLLLMMWVVVGIVVWKVLPIFTKVLFNMGSPLPSSASNMMAFGKIFALLSFIILTGLICMILFIVLQAKHGKNGNAKFLSTFVFTKNLYHNITMAKLTYALSLFISSGYDLEEALSYLPNIIDEPLSKQRVMNCYKGVQAGASFEDVMLKEQLYQGMYANMIITGFHSGKSDDVMKKVSSLYEKDVDVSIGGFLNTIEPAIVILLSLIVGVILLSVMLPLMSIMTSLS
ncbi:MAG: type II secretion system F family protein [Longicatena sp.]